MSLTAAATPAGTPAGRLDALFSELAELTGQRNAIDGRIVAIVAEIDRDGLWGSTGARSVPALVAWKTGCSPSNAERLTAVARRSAELPRCTQSLQEGRCSLDQVAVIAERAGAGAGCDGHYAQLVEIATVAQLRTAVKLEPRPEPDRPRRHAAITKTGDDEFDFWRITLAHTDSAVFESALASHRDTLVSRWRRDHHDTDPTGEPTAEKASGRPPMPTTVDAFMALVHAGWDAEAAARPHGQRTTVVVHLDVKEKLAGLHLGPLLTDAERRYLTCDATAEVWFERDGRPIGCGRSTRTVNRRLRRALEARQPTCAVPGCGASRGLHAHHIVHWEDGGPTELANLVLLCPFHHRLHHSGGLTITGPADQLQVADADGHPLRPGSLARTPTGPPPAVPPCSGPLGENADWWWYDPYQPHPPPDN